MLQDYDQFVAAVQNNGDVAVGQVHEVTANKLLHVVCIGVTNAEGTALVPSASPPSASSALPSISLQSGAASHAVRDTLLFVVTDFKETCLVGRAGVFELSKVAEGTPWGVRVGLIFTTIRHSSSIAGSDGHAGIRHYHHHTQQQQQHSSRNQNMTLRLAEDSNTGKPLLVADVASPMVMRFVVALTPLSTEAHRLHCTTFAINSALRSHSAIAEALENERRRRIGAEEALEKAQAACAAAGVVAGRDDRHTDHGLMSRGKLQKPQSLLHPAHTTGVKRARGVKIE